MTEVWKGLAMKLRLLLGGFALITALGVQGFLPRLVNG